MTAVLFCSDLQGHVVQRPQLFMLGVHRMWVGTMLHAQIDLTDFIPL